MAEDTVEGVAGARRPGRTVLLVLLAAATLAAGFCGAWYLLPAAQGAWGTARAGRAADPSSVGALLALEPFVANLADEDDKRYLKAALQVEFFDTRVPVEFQARVPQMRDLILTLLTSKLFAEVRTPQGKAVLRDQIITRMNRALNRDAVKAVYFTEFIVQ